MNFDDGDYHFQGFQIPQRMMGGIERWIKYGILPGDFLTAIICNDLSEAVGRADNENMANLPAYVSYFYSMAPAACWGSPEKVKAWVGVETRRKEREAAT